MCNVSFVHPQKGGPWVSRRLSVSVYPGRVVMMDVGMHALACRHAQSTCGKGVGGG
jgi:hypothetical protein